MNLEQRHRSRVQTEGMSDAQIKTAANSGD